MTNMTPSPELVERVARAIFAAGFSANEDRGLIDQCWDDWTEDRERAFHHARAAIAALSEATHLEEVVRALTRIADGQSANAKHDGHCLCNSCAMSPGELREIASAALTLFEVRR